MRFVARSDFAPPAFEEFCFACRFRPRPFDHEVKAWHICLPSAEDIPSYAEAKGQNMRVMVLVKACKESESGLMPVRQKLEEIGKFNDELVKAGIMLVGEGLKPSSKGVRVRFSGTDRFVTDGPFAETNELVAGY